jgi:DNA-binding response OmpR family regulator
MTTPKQTSEKPIPAGSQPKAGLVLVVEDDRSLRESICELLTLESLGVCVAGTGSEATLALEENDFNLAIVDVQLPDVSGYQLCQDMKRNPHWRKIPVVMITGRFTEPQDKIQGLESGADEFLTKPFDPSYFIARVKSILRGVPA